MEETLTQYLAIAGAVILAARIIAHGVAKLTSITPSTRDDEIVTTAQKWIARLQALLGAISVSSDNAEKSAAKKGRK